MAIYYDMYKKLGSHYRRIDGQKGTQFAVWAPNADRVSVIGEFNKWNTEENIMQRDEKGIFKIFIPGVCVGMQYKYCIMLQNGEKFLKADPFAMAAELRPGTSSVVADISDFQWKDQGWLEKRSKWDFKSSPLSVYEIHIGSWKKPSDGRMFCNYREFAHEAAEYIIELGYTHVELMGIAEYPYDGSWGYQVTGYYAPTARYGSPEDFAYMVNYFHEKNIGVILDWVPAHFANDVHGLADFDGTPLFEYEDEKRGNHVEWGTKIFDYGKEYVSNFLISNALFWVEQYHIDGIRVDAVASMVYLNYGKCYGEWEEISPEENYNMEAIDFLRQLNSAMIERNLGVVMIAEESSTFPKVTESLEKGGLGFHFKWNMGWMHDLIEYLKMDQEERRKNHYNMTFASSYMFEEKYMLEISHDEVVHLKKSMLNKIHGFMDEKFADLKTAYTYMIGHPGKKLLFMGQEFAQYNEWNENEELDWYLLNDRRHKGIQNYWKDLLNLYKKNQALYELDYERGGFEWMNADDRERSVYSFVRYSKGQKERLLFVCNFSAYTWKDYRIGVPEQTQYKVLINSDDIKYGGEGKLKEEIFETEIRSANGQSFSFVFDLPAHSAMAFTF